MDVSCPTPQEASPPCKARRIDYPIAHGFSVDLAQGQAATHAEPPPNTTSHTPDNRSTASDDEPHAPLSKRTKVDHVGCSDSNAAKLRTTSNTEHAKTKVAEHVDAHDDGVGPGTSVGQCSKLFPWSAPGATTFRLEVCVRSAAMRFGSV